MLFRSRPNVGVVLDSWHWRHAQETVEDLLRLTDREVVAVDLADAPRGAPLEQMPDLVRELPFATGVIDLVGFLGALRRIGVRGPVRAEPFGATLDHLPLDDAVAAAAASLRRAFDLLQADDVSGS